MWFVGLMIGLALGGIAGGGNGAVLGALVGGFAGWAIAQSSRTSNAARASNAPGRTPDPRTDAILKAVAELSARIAVLEERAGISSPAPAERASTAFQPVGNPGAVAPAAAIAVAPPGASLESVMGPPSTAPDDLAALPTALAAVEAAVSEPPPLASRLSEGEPSGLVAQVLGAVIGAVIGAIGGLSGAAFCAFIGWMAVAAVQSQNRRAARDALRYRSGKLLDRRPAAPLQRAPAESALRATEPPQPEFTAQPEFVPPPEFAPQPDFASQPEPARAPRARAPTSGTAASRGSGQSVWMQRLIGGNIVAKIGVLILFFGVGFLLKYAYDHAVLPVPVRLAGVALAGFAMLYAGRRLLQSRRLYALILQGGGIGLLYLDVYFALKVYGLVDATTGFAAFMILGVAATLLAVRQDAKILAVLGLTGAFLAPVLAGSNTGNPMLLFTYYTMLNSFILAISWFKAWRDLNLVGFIFTFAVGVLWGAGNYRPEHFASVEPFVLVFFAMYLVIPILFAQRQPPNLKGLVDGTLVFGTPLCVAFMQASLVRDMPYGLAWSAGVASALYAVLAFMTFRRDGMRLLAETYIALCVVFLTLAIFFAFEGYPTFALWTLEGAAIVWVGLRQQRLLARFFGLALQLAGAGYFVLKYSTYDLSNPWWNAFVSGCVIIATAGFIIARLLHRHGDVIDPRSEPGESLMLVWAAGWAWAAGVHALYHAYPWPEFLSGLLAYAALTVAAAELIGTRMQWLALRRIAMAHLPALIAIALLIAFGDAGRLQFARPLAHGGYWAWPLNFILLFWVLARHARDGLLQADSLLYRGAWILVASVATWDVLWLLDRDRHADALVWGAAGIAAGYLRFRLRERGRGEAVPIATAVLVWGVVFWFVAGLSWIEHALQAPAKSMAMLSFLVASCLVFEACGSLARWTPLRRVAALLPVGMLFALAVQFTRDAHPFAAYGFLAWPCAVALLYIVLRRHEDDGIAVLPAAQHVVGLWIAVMVLTWECQWQLRAAGFGKAWLTAVCAAVPTAVLAGVSRFSARPGWPFGVHYEKVYGLAALGPIAAYLALWMVYANLAEPGPMKPLPYLPVLNPLDVVHIALFAALWRWSGALPDLERSKRIAVFAAFGFLWVNCVLLRTIHYWAGVAYHWDALARSVLVQSGFSLLWTATAFVLMLNATRERRRHLWMVGAALLGVVVLKLFVNDLSNTGTVARIVSFIGVGAGLLLIGYVAPVPPGDTERPD